MCVNSVCLAPMRARRLDRFGQRKMRQVLLMLQRVEHQDVQIFQQGK